MTTSSKVDTSEREPEVLVRCQHLGKRFCRDLKRSLWYGVQDIAHDFMGWPPHGSPAPQASTGDTRPGLRPQEFWAVEDISFEVRRGQCLGLIGKNGAGKTTILKMLCGLIKPDHGEIELSGRVGGLIALGAGFNPLLTGRENVYVNGSILGMTKRQIDEKFEAIEAFADIGEFIDAPVQSYSSGMQVRLGFAIAAVVTKPDILLLDEVLAVGDMGFTMKCLNAVREMAADSAVIFVSHNMQWISTFCTDVMVLRNGRIHTYTSNASEGIGAYMECFDTAVGISGSGQAIVSNAYLSDADPDSTDRTEKIEFQQGSAVQFNFEARVEDSCLPTDISLYIMDQGMNPVICFPDVPHEWLPCHGGFRNSSCHVPLGPLELNAGRYSFIILIQERATSKCLARIQGIVPFRVCAKSLHWATVVRQITTVSQVLT